MQVRYSDKILTIDNHDNIFETCAEAKAAKAAELQVIVLDRPGNAPLSDADRTEFKVVTSFADIVVDGAASSGKRKLADEDVATEPEVTRRKS